MDRLLARICGGLLQQSHLLGELRRCGGGLVTLG
jgi:hypothetical protein